MIRGVAKISAWLARPHGHSIVWVGKHDAMIMKLVSKLVSDTNFDTNSGSAAAFCEQQRPASGRVQGARLAATVFGKRTVPIGDDGEDVRIPAGVITLFVGPQRHDFFAFFVVHGVLLFRFDFGTITSG